tara:strand:+ start:1122 stop:2231 length:1110 start_codon:yes stop_codon:yes gene_type:complete
MVGSISSDLQSRFPSHVKSHARGGTEPIGGGSGSPVPTIGHVARNFFGNNTSRSYVFNNLTTNTYDTPLHPRDVFLNLLDSWQFSLPLNQLWMVFFDVPPLVSNETMSSLGENIVNVGDNESVNLARDEFLPTGQYSPDKYMRTLGCAFAQSVKLPQEQNAISKIGQKTRGFLKAPILDQRQQFASINIEFLETNLSFVDFLIRPWIVMSSHLGYVARPSAPLTTDIILVNFAKGGTDFEFRSPTTHPAGYDPSQDQVHIQNTRGFVARKMYLYTGCTPINTSTERYGYTNEGAIDRRDTEWAFRQYQVMTPSMFSEAMQCYDEIDTYDNGLIARSFWSEYQERIVGEHIYRKGTAPGKGWDILDILGL